MYKGLFYLFFVVVLFIVLIMTNFKESFMAYF
ncbi:hypothetical protein B14_02100 [Bacillus licheniformis]|jgi:hypothetical protein|uniref:Uncharacterized protein n=1 Tax=Bacillus licheniformis (strain ATCC 14580 / DSM 13 / JCM 2505 / CCUG 7422 / NBRC 12200 / NCIMB 9375 / NCTC 10341 / NRRL NRS-1264 / Gibson 46) TaxID=279010 RepID=Q62TM8_BACLD|nr:hypothetical protein BL02734 [Bacillus licheniformis DSM 13 = ATCC 14580]AKQ73554.1 hypothetical protein MUY_002422 [Bacillus licheniformis WX-02]AOP15522.1 hypothetical protein BL1202_02575 [Bacillus licheniformis]EQM27539.1 hypothetical protein N399_13170 [Bacillus licheniformis CG-B52]ETB69499.1 hypothetical protein A943_19725 [Bacillus sp. CPSM8]KFM91331.1 putative membrane protein [Bacillus paralicheniformis]KUL06928.1 hypothetical protein LI7559_19900 [Bacillus licheniformis LMG 7559